MINGQACAIGDIAETVMTLADAATDEILGVHAAGSLASEKFAEAVVAIRCDASSGDITRIRHTRLTRPKMREATNHAAFLVCKRKLNS